MDALKFTPAAITPSYGFGFGLSKEQAAAQLRILADEIEGGMICLQKVQVGSVASHDEWCTRAVMIEYADRDTAEKRRIAAETLGNAKAEALYGGSLAPAAHPSKE